MKKPLVFVVLATIALVACNSEAPQAPEPLKTGIMGQVVVGPMLPICLEDDPACFHPVEATFHLFRDSVEVLTFQTGPNGNFQVEVSAGDYDLVGGEDAPEWVTGKTLHITVPDGPMITVRLVFITPIV